MRSGKVLCLLVLLFTSLANPLVSGQTQEAKQGFGVGLEHLIEPETFRWNLESSLDQRVVSEHLFQDGILVKILNAPGAIVIANVGLNLKAKRFEVTLLIANDSSRPLDVLPQNRGLQNTGSSKNLKAISSEKIAQEIEKKARSQAGWMMAGAWWLMRNRSISVAETQGSATASAAVMGPGGITNGNINGRYSESTTTTTTSPNYQAQQWAYDRATNHVEQAQDQASRVRKAALLANTLDPKAMAIGMLFFERDKHAKEIIVKVGLGRNLYEIPFQVSELTR